MNRVIFTVGHSTKPIDVFVRMLQSLMLTPVSYTHLTLPTIYSV